MFFFFKQKTAYEMRISDWSSDVCSSDLRRGFGGFGGVKRRFTKTGETGGITVIDDYGHHPVEIAAVLRAARAAATGKVIAVVQPHRYSRLEIGRASGRERVCPYV